MMSPVRTLATCVVEHRDDVAAYYNCLHEMAAPHGVVWDASIGGWLITSYSLCATLLKSPQLGRQRIELPRTSNPELVECAERILNRQLMFSDDAAERRADWQRRLNDAARDDLEQRLRHLAQVCLNEATSTPLEAYRAVLQPFASRVAAQAVGLEESERAQLYPLIAGCVRFLDGKIRSESDFDSAMFSIVALYDRLGVIFGRQVEEKGAPTWVADLLLALVAGHESTAYLLGTIFVQGRAGREAPTPRLVQESLRFDSPVQVIGRRAKQRIELPGVTIDTGARVFLHVGAANRDASVFTHPERFDARRSAPPPLSFGLGEGQCLGRSLAIRSARAFLDVLLSRGAWLSISGDVRRTSGISGRGFQVLPARFESTAASGAGIAQIAE